MELIDRYVPRHTREEVVEMSIRYEERITALLHTIHDYHQRCHGLQVHLAELEEEYAKRTMIPVSSGLVTAEAGHDLYRMATYYRVDWRPDPRRAVISLRDEPLRQAEFPHLFNAAMKQFETQVLRELTDQLRGEYGKLYEATRPK
ncbi:hypothetical protein CO661_24170 [Sinorhizobium fredii]|uniref:Uncharacterized protein n=1 Tax=Rhizobium fredii TaxID=380 RepID=A0A2A6LS34_RHIFR|nr:hypothetical protein [Sinorhizobium fredii]PDT45361.1 hypothetical protein CO661_24170 [Sinorhizobium fredii]